MEMHPRFRKAQSGRLKVSEALLNLQQELELTNIEMLQALNEYESSMLKYMLREERHPDDPDKPGDQA